MHALQVSQGVTTVVVGNCGISLRRCAWRPGRPRRSTWSARRNLVAFDSFGEYAQLWRATPAAVNTVALIGHMSLRVSRWAATRIAPRRTSEAERMRGRLAEALAEGASGFSTGLYYPPISWRRPTR